LLLLLLLLSSRCSRYHGWHLRSFSCHGLPRPLSLPRASQTTPLTKQQQQQQQQSNTIPPNPNPRKVTKTEPSKSQQCFVAESKQSQYIPLRSTALPLAICSKQCVLSGRKTEFEAEAPSPLFSLLSRLVTLLSSFEGNQDLLLTSSLIVGMIINIQSRLQG
jgi:hypothetical protein